MKYSSLKNQNHLWRRGIEVGLNVDEKLEMAINSEQPQGLGEWTSVH